jgi:1-phosphofructokinase family hexose kinase
MIVCAAASPSIDKLFVVERLEAGAVHRPREFLQLPGGKAINVARAVIALGGRVEAVGLAGGHAGRWLGEATDTEGIPARFVRCGSETRASLSVLDLDRGLLTEFYEAAAPVERAEWEAFSSAVASALGGGDWLAISGSLPADAPADGYAELVARAHAAGARAAIDARGPTLALTLEAAPEVVKVNAAEAAETLGAAVGDLDAALAAASALRTHGGDAEGVAVVTHGEEGAALALRDGSLRTGRLGTRGPFAVGSGDAFLAGLLIGHERRRSWEEAFALALAAGAANAERPGPGRLDPARAEALRLEVDLQPAPAPVARG